MPEKQIVLRNRGLIDPKSIDSFIARDGFKALTKALGMAPDQVIGEIKASNLRGRGGAGFPCGLKWEMVRNAPGDDKFIICNADEGEVGTFKDRVILQTDPFSLVEALAIGGHALGAGKGYVYLRGEYRFLLGLLTNAIGLARERGFLGHIDIEVRIGAGAYVCGEESALMESLEGKRGEVRYRPPFPPQKGLFEKPTSINNVETLMNIPPIVLNGAAWFNQSGTEKSKGTKVFSVAGDVKRPGVYELVLGSTLRELVEGLAQAENVKAIQIGGATGRLVPYSMIDTPLAFESLLGAGAVTVYDTSRDIIEIVCHTMEFLAEESCGKCVPCRQGTEAMAEAYQRFSQGEADEDDIRHLRELSSVMMLGSLCGLGQAAPSPVLDSMQYFKEDYDRLVRRKLEVK